MPLLAIFMVFGTPVAIIWLILRHRERRHGLQQAEGLGASGAQLMALADRMEKRIDALEQILDTESPGWRKKYHEHP
ncbi:envelope stress response membrane protein PspB [Fontimonas sp. SYSU GA230001]|uniref:envelope stress response membrane protein PspB n=1 Tax=Fontimonas sp. SYSU GA230001 TaxID=3142450 RepID=UPI0032B6237E